MNFIYLQPPLHSTAQYKDQFQAEFKQLGRGKYGQVFEVHYGDGKTCAAKEYLNVEREEIVRLFAEWVGMGLQHENLVTYHKVHCILDSERAVLFMDHVKQSLPDIIDKPRMRNPVTILLVLSGVARGFQLSCRSGKSKSDEGPTIQRNQLQTRRIS